MNKNELKNINSSYLSLYFLITFFFQAYLLTQGKDQVGKISLWEPNYPLK